MLPIFFLPENNFGCRANKGQIKNGIRVGESDLRILRIGSNQSSAPFEPDSFSNESS
jgi:hypothetical protein